MITIREDRPARLPWRDRLRAEWREFIAEMPTALLITAITLALCVIALNLAWWR